VIVDYIYEAITLRAKGICAEVAPDEESLLIGIGLTDTRDGPQGLSKAHEKAHCGRAIIGISGVIPGGPLPVSVVNAHIG
jgi:hypothetical protein